MAKEKDIKFLTQGSIFFLLLQCTSLNECNLHLLIKLKRKKKCSSTTLWLFMCFSRIFLTAQNTEWWMFFYITVAACGVTIIVASCRTSLFYLVSIQKYAFSVHANVVCLVLKRNWMRNKCQGGEDLMFNYDKLCLSIDHPTP